MRRSNDILDRLPPFAVPPLLILCGWLIDNIVPRLIDHGDRELITLFAIYDFAGKWLFYGYIAYCTTKCRRGLIGKPKGAWLTVWILIWIMLLFEVVARFLGLFNWMGSDWFREELHGYCYDCPEEVNLSLVLFWARRPLVAFGVSYLICEFWYWIKEPDQ